MSFKIPVGRTGQRKELPTELKEQGYDSVLFADFKDRTMVFPEHMERQDRLMSINHETDTAAGLTADEVAWRKTDETSEEPKKS